MTSYKTKKGKEELKLKIDEYFNRCDMANENQGKVVKPYTLSGLLCHLNISSEELSQLCRVRELRKIINSAKLRIESHIEENALNGKLSGSAAINSLKCNFGWNEKNTKDEGVKTLSVVLEDRLEALGE